MEQTPCLTAVFQQPNEETRSTGSQRQELLSLQSLGNSIVACRGFPGGASGKEPACQCRPKSQGCIPGSGRSPGGGYGYPMQYSCLENPMDRGAWWVTVHRVTKRLKQLSTHAAAAAAESLQSCPTLCDPVDGSLPGSPVPGILQARTLEWVAISFSSA